MTQRPQEFTDQILSVIPPVVGTNGLQRILQGFAKRILQLERYSEDLGKIAYVNMPLQSGVTGSALYCVASGWCYVKLETSFASVAAGSARAIVGAGVLPASILPAGVRRGYFSGGLTMGRIDVNTSGLINAIPLTGSATGAAGFVIFPIGI